MLKNLRHVVASLAEGLEKEIARVEEAILPVSRYRGITSLPSEIIVNIMTLAGGRFHMDMEGLDKLMWTFLDVEPFKSHVPHAPLLLQEWRRRDKWSGTLPPPSKMENITVFQLSDAAKFKLRDFTGAMSEMRSLQHLEINCNFDVGEWGPYEGTEVELPSLTSLAVAADNQLCDGVHDDQLFEPLQVLVRKLHMPKLECIRASMYTVYGDELVELEDLDKVFGFPDRSYPHVSTFELNWTYYAEEDNKRRFSVRLMLECLPALQRLTLRSNSVRFVPPHTYNLMWETATLKHLRFLRMELGEDICDTISELIDYLDNASSGSLCTRGEITLMTIGRKHATPFIDERIHRATNRSILD